MADDSVRTVGDLRRLLARLPDELPLGGELADLLRDAVRRARKPGPRRLPVRKRRTDGESR